MDEEEIKKVISMTIDDLFDKKMIREEKDLSYRFMGMKLAKYYKGGEKNEKIEKALEKIKE